ncbi:GTP-binding domain [Pandoravirus neocaledonia]|uniref:YspA cpYpsA-related SLOG domain-containing protein n=1 Tax=Pandoravirus neocaledonia TaxID=2107708 RepID=A0A2U7UDP6_9VIRU|nr:GTP-binding domain [Pandoravirus neocaledonia]AVK76475.1 hypothetical protein pneo_cds_868 [Pandoravirus neocaledonia]
MEALSSCATPPLSGRLSQSSIATHVVKVARPSDGDGHRPRVGEKDTATPATATTHGPIAGERKNQVQPLRMAVIGGRDFADRAVMERCLDDLSASLGRPRAIVSGGATGADRLAAVYARSRGIPLVEFRPDYAACRTPQEGRVAPLLRNARIIEAADVVVAFWDGRSRGTADGLARARRAGLVRHVYDYTGKHRSPP